MRIVPRCSTTNKRASPGIEARCTGERSPLATRSRRTPCPGAQPGAAAEAGPASSSVSASASERRTARSLAEWRRQSSELVLFRRVLQRGGRTLPGADHGLHRVEIAGADERLMLHGLVPVALLH